MVPIHGGVIVTEGAGDEHLRVEDVGAHAPASTNWTIESSEGWRGIDRQASVGHQWFVAGAPLTVVAVVFVWPGASVLELMD